MKSEKGNKAFLLFKKWQKRIKYESSEKTNFLCQNVRKMFSKRMSGFLS